MLRHLKVFRHGNFNECLDEDLYYDLLINISHWVRRFYQFVWVVYRVLDRDIPQETKYTATNQKQFMKSELSKTIMNRPQIPKIYLKLHFLDFLSPLSGFVIMIIFNEIKDKVGNVKMTS